MCFTYVASTYSTCFISLRCMLHSSFILHMFQVVLSQGPSRSRERRAGGHGMWHAWRPSSGGTMGWGYSCRGKANGWGWDWDEVELEGGGQGGSMSGVRGVF
jgi:hypothetical protein